MIYPKASCGLLSSRGELFEDVSWVGCSGARQNKLLGGDGEVLAENGKLIRTTADAAARYYRCKSVNSASIKRTGDVFEVFFRVKAGNRRQFVHNIYSFKWNRTMNAPVWVRHVPSASFSDPSVIDTQVRAPWRYSKLVFGYDNDPRRAFKLAYKKYRMSRGHLAPAGDFLLAAERWATFQLSNVVPQPQTHNNGKWKEIEDHVRTKFNKKMIKYVETGPISDENGETETLDGIVPVPKGLYKKVIGRDDDRVLYEVRSLFS
nr:MAG: wsv191-like protein [Hemigrapsus takanoi nimavirus]